MSQSNAPIAANGNYGGKGTEAETTKTDEACSKRGKRSWLGAAEMEMKSTAFRAGGAIPRRFTCEGENVSPPISWTDIPGGTRSLTLILHDPDAPRQGGFTHWILFNIDPELEELVEDVAHTEDFATVGIEGSNDSGQTGYMGPCPPTGRHRYIARLYALNTILTVNTGARLAEVESAMEGHILEKAALMGTYAKELAA